MAAEPSVLDERPAGDLVRGQCSLDVGAVDQIGTPTD